MNLNKPWKFADETVDVVYGSHVFEHLSLKFSKRFLEEADRVLKIGGIIRLVVPDLFTLADQYVGSFRKGDSAAADEFLCAANLHQENAYPDSKIRLIRFVSSLQRFPHQHKYMYDSLSLAECLRKFGFRDMKQCPYGSSYYIPEIKDVECTAEGIPSIYLEARKG